MSGQARSNRLSDIFLLVGTGGIRAVAGSYFWGFAEKGAEMFDKKYYQVLRPFASDDCPIASCKNQRISID